MSSFKIPKFVGREDLLREAVQALQKDTHVFVRGPFGIGKTTFAKEVLKILKAPPIVISFLEPAHKMAEDFLKQFAEYKRSLRKKHKIERASISSDYKRLGQLKGELIKNRDLVKYVVVDNVFRASHQKLKFLRFLSDYGYKFIIIVESDKFQKEIFLMRSICHQQIQLALPRLNKKETISLIGQYKRTMGGAYSSSEVEALANQLKGYPLMIVERMNRA